MILRREECCCCVEGVVDDDEVVVSAGVEWEGVFALLVEGQLDGVGDADDVDFAQESGDVEGDFVSFGGDFHGKECFVISCLDGQAVYLFECDEVALSGTNAEALKLSQSLAKSYSAAISATISSTAVLLA